MYNVDNFILPITNEKFLKLRDDVGAVNWMIMDPYCTVKQVLKTLVIKQKAESDPILLEFDTNANAALAHVKLRDALKILAENIKTAEQSEIENLQQQIDNLDNDLNNNVTNINNTINNVSNDLSNFQNVFYDTVDDIYTDINNITSSIGSMSGSTSIYLYVDRSRGNDSTAQQNNMFKPYATINGAYDACKNDTSGNTFIIWVYGSINTYIENVFLHHNIKYWFEYNARVMGAIQLDPVYTTSGFSSFYNFGIYGNGSFIGHPSILISGQYNVAMNIGMADNGVRSNYNINVNVNDITGYISIDGSPTINLTAKEIRSTNTAYHLRVNQNPVFTVTCENFTYNYLLNASSECIRVHAQFVGEFTINILKNAYITSYYGIFLSCIGSAGGKVTSNVNNCVITKNFNGNTNTLGPIGGWCNTDFKITGNYYYYGYGSLVMLYNNTASVAATRKFEMQGYFYCDRFPVVRLASNHRILINNSQLKVGSAGTTNTIISIGGHTGATPTFTTQTDNLKVEIMNSKLNKVGASGTTPLIYMDGVNSTTIIYNSLLHADAAGIPMIYADTPAENIGYFHNVTMSGTTAVTNNCGTNTMYQSVNLPLLSN